MIVPLWLLPYLLVLGGGGWLGEAIHFPALGWTVGFAAATGYGIWRRRIRRERQYELQAQHQWLTGELQELGQRRAADAREASA
jgi:hypothetical protein